MSVTVLLPATDETSALEKTVDVLCSTLGRELQEILIITSQHLTTNETLDVIRRLGAQYGERIITFAQLTPGLGGAYRDGFDAARGEYIILMASDLETDPETAPALLQAIRQQDADVVTCSRWLLKTGFAHYHPVKYICNYFFQKFFQSLYNVKLTDLTFGYRVYKKDVAQNIPWEEEGFAFLFESLVKPLKLNKRVSEIPSAWNRRREGSSHISIGSYIHYFKIGIKTLFMK